jgi:chondroitin 4-sulfotransferase 11
MIHHRKKFIFIHIPKCGGSSITKQAFFKKRSQENAHKSISEYAKTKDLTKFKQFSITRNPWDRIVSLYFFWRNMNKKHPYYKWDKYAVQFIHDKNLNFEEFVQAIYSKNSKKFFFKSYDFENHKTKKEIDHTKSQRSLLENNGLVNLTFIGRFENLQNDFDKICDIIKIPRSTLPHANKSPHKHYSEYYNDRTREMIERKYKEDIKEFGYNFWHE